MRLATAIYLIVGLINIYAQFVGDLTINQFTKPILMPVLIYLVFVKADGFVNLPRLLLALALVFAWIGDMLLLMQGEELYFLGGLGSFLIMQVLYTLVFYKSMQSPALPKSNIIIPSLIGFVVIAYGAFHYAGIMWIPVVIYALCILTMLAFALNRQSETSNQSFLLTTVGATLFVISDSLIGVNKFMMEIPYAPFLIMATYIPAQYLIMQGVMIHEKN
ncbi:MAG: hypothetical protein CMP48_07380 [Rickettsiales bacterium]|nr:hypothetical protein [Rickettsiales bacterium]